MAETTGSTSSSETEYTVLNLSFLHVRGDSAADEANWKLVANILCDPAQLATRVQTINTEEWSPDGEK